VAARNEYKPDLPASIVKFAFSLDFLRAEFKERVKMLIRRDYLSRVVKIVQTA
jgi:hypothetical protein